MLNLQNIHKTFFKSTPDEHTLFGGLNLTVDEGEFVTVVGGNGAGKSTLFNLVCGTLFPDRGKIILDGKDITYLPEHRRAAGIGRIFQDPSVGTAPHLTVEENLGVAYMRSSGRSGFGTFSRKDRAFFREKLAGLNMGLEDKMNVRMGLLSGGQRQAVTLVMATAVKPKLLLLDEHTAALDPLSTRKVMEITREIVAADRLTTLMITHNISSALENGTRTLMLDEGAVAIDIRGEERDGMTSEALLERFAQVRHKQFDYDRAVLS